MRYLFAVIADGNTAVDASPDEEMAIDAFNDKIDSAGVRVMAAGVAAPGQSRLCDNRNGLGRVRNGLAVETDLFMAGFWIIEADDDAAAEELAMEASLACNRMIEVRPFLRRA